LAKLKLSGWEPSILVIPGERQDPDIQNSEHAQSLGPDFRRGNGVYKISPGMTKNRKWRSLGWRKYRGSASLYHRQVRKGALGHGEAGDVEGLLARIVSIVWVTLARRSPLRLRQWAKPPRP
jgi:hypothetical protein